MKHIILLGDGMADHPIAKLGNHTLLQHAHTPNMDWIAAHGATGMLRTIPEGFHPGSEVANTSILGYDLTEVYEGRGPLEAASIGYEMADNDLALRCNIITLSDGLIQNHHGGHLTTEEGDLLIKHLQEHLGNDRVCFMTGIQYRHLLVIKGGSKFMEFAPPHDNPLKEWQPRLAKAMANAPREAGRMSAEETAGLINDLIISSQKLLSSHPFNLKRLKQGIEPANSIWPWGGGYRPSMLPLSKIYPNAGKGVVISAVDLIRGIGHYAGLEIVKVPGATGMYDTNYQGKVEAAIKALEDHDFVYLHIEASDEAGHDGDMELKIRTVSDFDAKVVGPILEMAQKSKTPVSIAVLPDHPTPVEVRTHVAEPVPFAIWHVGIKADEVTEYNEVACKKGRYGMLQGNEFMNVFFE